MERLKLGLVGIGGFGQVLLKVIRKLQEEDRVELSAVGDIHLEKFLHTLEEKPLGTIRTHSDYDRFLNRERHLDAIIIATPIPLHADQSAHLHGNNCNHRDQRIAQGVLPDNDALLKPFCPSSYNVLFAEHFQHGRTCLPHDGRCKSEPDGKCWHRQVLQIFYRILEETYITGGRQPPRLNRKQQNEKYPHPEGRHGYTDH